jgi:hypothetical protein
MIPQIHRNGSSVASLISDLCDAAGKIGDALDALSKIAQNGRDYYTISDAAFSAARKEHTARIQKLMDIHAELYAIIDGIQSQES